MRHGATRETFVPFSSRHFSLNGFQNYFAEGAVLLARVTAKPVVEFFRNVLDLDVGHVKTIACQWHAGKIRGLG